MTPIIRAHIDHPSAWRPADFPSKEVFSFELERRHIEAFDRAVAKLEREGAASYEGIGRCGFDLSAIEGDIRTWLAELREGRGILNLRGFPVSDRPLEHLSLAYYGLGACWGKIVSQSVLGDRIGHIIAVDQLLHGERRRSYKSTHEMRLHSDFCDILGMLCIRPAASGGESRYTSGVSVHNEILARRPELLEPLYEGVHFWRLGEYPHEPVTPCRVPLFSSCEGLLSVHYAGDRSFFAPENTGVALGERELEAIDYFVEVAESEALRYDFPIEVGECLFSNNLIHLHARAEIRNAPDPALRRHMLRIWIDCDPSFRPVVPELYVFGHGLGIPANPDLVHAPGVEM